MMNVSGTVYNLFIAAIAAEQSPIRIVMIKVASAPTTPNHVAQSPAFGGSQLFSVNSEIKNLYPENNIAMANINITPRVKYFEFWSSTTLPLKVNNKITIKES